MDARIPQTPIPFDAARAYGLGRGFPVRQEPGATAPTARVEISDQVELSASTPRPAKLESLIAAKVDVRVEFTPSRPASDGTLQLYRHPADKNAAATGVDAGRTLDIRG